MKIFHVRAAWQIDCIKPRLCDISIGMIHGQSRASLPTPDSVSPVGYACGRGNQKAPIGGPAHGMGIEPPVTAKAPVVFIVRFQVNDGMDRFRVRGRGGRPLPKPLEIIRRVSVPALVAYETEPGLLAKLRADPLLPAGVNGCQAQGILAKNSFADPLPAFPFFTLVVPISGQYPNDLVGAVACDHVA